MTTQTISLEESPPLWRVMLENLPYDPLSIVVYIMLAGFIYVIWRNASFDRTPPAARSTPRKPK